MDESRVVAKVVESLRKVREEKGVSRYRIAKETGLSPSGIRHMENGDVTPTLYFLLRISAFLEADLAEMIAAALSEQQMRQFRKSRNQSLISLFKWVDSHCSVPVQVFSHAIGKRLTPTRVVVSPRRICMTKCFNPVDS